MFLGLDLGTTNVKALLVAADGRVVARGAAAVSCRHVGETGVEQDIEEIWAATLSAIGQAASGRDASGVKAIGVSSQGGALQILDDSGRPAGPVISWLDGRGRPYDQQITEQIGSEALFARTGHARGIMALGQLLRLREQSPELLAPPNRAAFVGDVIVGRLCGRRAHDATSLSCAVVYNPQLNSADVEMLRRVGIGEDQLPALLAPREPAGPLTGAAAGQTSLPAGIPVGPAVHDQYASALGANVIVNGAIMVGIGTAWVLLAVSAALPRKAVCTAYACRHVIEGLYGQMLPLGNGGSAVAWALELLGLSGLGGDEIDRQLRDAGVGSQGVCCWPFLAVSGAGLPSETAGRLHGLRLGHGRAALLRAVVEGLAFELARCIRLIAAAGVEVRRLVLCGGAAASGITPQIIADVTRLPAECLTESETAGIGAAVLARGLVEPQTPLTELARAMKPSARPVLPGPDADRYAELCERYLHSLPPPERSD